MRKALSIILTLAIASGLSTKTWASENDFLSSATCQEKNAFGNFVNVDCAVAEGKERMKQGFGPVWYHQLGKDGQQEVHLYNYQQINDFITRLHSLTTEEQKKMFVNEMTKDAIKDFSVFFASGSDDIKSSFNMNFQHTEDFNTYFDLSSVEDESVTDKDKLKEFDEVIGEAQAKTEQAAAKKDFLAYAANLGGGFAAMKAVQFLAPLAPWYVNVAAGAVSGGVLGSGVISMYKSAASSSKADEIEANKRMIKTRTQALQGILDKIKNKFWSLYDTFLVKMDFSPDHPVASTSLLKLDNNLSYSAEEKLLYAENFKGLEEKLKRIIEIFKRGEKAILPVDSVNGDAASKES